MSFDAFVRSLASPALKDIALHWGVARGANTLPSWEQIDLQALRAEVSLIWVYRYDAQTGRFTGRLAGDRITKALGKNLRGLPLDDAHSAKDYLWVHRYLTRVVTRAMGYRSAGKLYKQAGRFIEGERIALPLASDGANADGVLGASDYRQPHLEGPFEILTENEVWESLR
ncbi:MAG TPA: PAS domain-containing protein [Rhizomicrobium sp.]|nr:PAS domain-containing protein [Rhizomicrobium sp.]